MANPYSSLKIFHHRDVLDKIKKGEKFAPVYIRLKPTNICNHHCSYCTYGSGDTDNKTSNRNNIKHSDMIPWDKMQEIIEDMGNMGVKAVTFSGGGEPLTYPHIAAAAQNMTDRGIELSLITNGQLLDGERAKAFYGAKWLRISFDSPNAEEYAALRGISTESFHKVIGNIKDFAKNKDSDCVLGINFVVGKANYRRVYEAAELLKELGADNVKFAALIDNEPHYHRDIKDAVIEQIHRAQADLADDSFIIINNYENDWNDKNFTKQSFSICYTCRLVTVIAADQRVYFCHTRAYDKGAVVGDISKRPFREMWFSDETQCRLADLKPEMDCNNFCVYEERNKMIQAYFDTDMRHVNFI